jgi:hypothetical protein
MLSINLVIIFYFTLCRVLLLLIYETIQIFVMFDIQTTCRGSFVCFFPLAGGYVSQF